MAGGLLSTENRLGGDMLYVTDEDQAGRYFEQHDTRRASSQFSLNHRFSDQTTLSVKNSFTFFERSIEVPGFLFDGQQTDRKSTRLNSSHVAISYAVLLLRKK